MTDADEQPRSALLGHIAFGIAIAIVIARCLMLETIRDSASDLDGPAGPGAATAIVLDWLSFVPALLVIARRLANPAHVVRFTLAHALLALLAAWTLASVWWADDRFLSLLSATRVAGGAAIFWAVSQVATRAAHLRVVVGVLIGILLVNVMQGALYQNVDLADLREYWAANKQQILAQRGWREGDYMAQRFELKLLAGEMLNFSVSSNVLGALAVTAAIAAFGASMQRLEDRDDRGWAGALLIAGLGSVYILAHTGSKASWATLGTGIALLGGWRAARGLLARQRALLFCVGAIAVALGILAVVAVGLSRPGLPSDSLNFRWRYWVGSWPLVLERPLTGVGWGNFMDQYLRHRLPEAAEEIQDPHNFLVRWMVELGVVGLVLGLGWLIAWAWRVTSPHPWRASLRDAVAVPLVPQQRQGLPPSNGSSRPMPISRVLLTCVLAFALTMACTMDLGGDANYAFLETMRRAMFIGLIALAIGLVCIGRRGSADEPFHVDERPAPWLAAALFVGLLMLLLQSTIDMTLFQPGPWNVTMLAMGALLGTGAPSPAAVGARLASPAVDGRAMSPGDQRATQASPLRGAMPIAGSLASLVWITCGVLIVVPILRAESAARAGDVAMARRNLPLAATRYREARQRSPVANYAYALSEATASAAAPPREALDAAIAAAPHHAMSWLSRSRFLSSRPDVSPADAQQAVDDFARAIALNPNDVDLRIEHADLLERLGRRAEAADQLLAALALNDKLDEAEPERLELRAPGKYEAIRSRINALRATTTLPVQ